MEEPPLNLVDAECNDSDASTTSTIKYEGQKSFRSFAVHVAKLIRQRFQPRHDVEIEHMKGGGYNRVTGVRLSDGVQRVVVRSPRFNSQGVCHDILDQVATLRYIHALKTIPVPNPLFHDIGSENPLGWPYVIQPRMEGRTLQWWLCHLEGDDLMDIAKAVIHVTRDICRTTFPSAGVIRAKDATADEIRFTLPGSSETAQTPQNPYHNTLSFLHDCFDSYMEPNDVWTNSYLKRLKEFATQLNAEKPFSNRFSLWHSDYEPRNLLARRNSCGKLVIEAVLDFDEAVAAPIEAAWIIPHWLWTWDPKVRDSDIEHADAVPVNDQLRRVKEFVESQMEAQVPGSMDVWLSGKTFRELFYFAMYGFSHGQHIYQRADQLIGPPPDDWWRESDDDESEEEPANDSEGSTDDSEESGSNDGETEAASPASLC